MFNVGRVCIKTAGRDAGNYCAIIEVLDDKFVMIDGLTRRRKVNVSHIEPTTKTVEIKDKAETTEVLEALKKAGIAVPEKKQASKDRKENAGRPVKQKVKREKVAKKKTAKPVAAKKETTVKKTDKKATKKTEKKD